jgi:hypothetical protein
MTDPDRERGVARSSIPGEPSDERTDGDRLREQDVQRRRARRAVFAAVRALPPRPAAHESA